jgi:2-succinyl-5-enolpyruvyl-6-hydroxy-3-cyclohexene-1-carboxylate synthase
MSNKNLNYEWSSIIVDELIANGVDFFCISPGSRSTSLVTALAYNKPAKKTLILDERSAAFHALGYAKATNKPAVLICTSGTALANYYPAIIEASHSNIPLLIISSDRPPELQDTGANQTINQSHFYSNYVRFEFSLPCPSTDISTNIIRSKIDQAVFNANYPKAGPVHINCMFRKPLIDYTEKADIDPSKKSPFISYTQPIISLDKNILLNITNKINSAKNGLLIIGELKTDSEKEVVKNLANKLGWSVVTDVLSGLSLDSNIDNRLSFSELISESNKASIFNNFSTVLYIGGKLVSTKLEQYLHYRKCETIMVSDNFSINNPNHTPSIKIESNIIEFCNNLQNNIPENKKKNSNNESLTILKDKIDNIVNSLCNEKNKISEISVAKLVSKHIKTNSGLFLGNSMPIRYMNNFGTNSNNVRNGFIPTGSNRGASGIDGIISTASGFAKGLNKKVTLVIGDLSFIHDMSSLSILENQSIELTIIAINNNGGGMFSFLPISKKNDICDKYFATPQNKSFDSIADIFGLKYYNPSTNKDFIGTYIKCQNKIGSSIIEIKTNRKNSLIEYKQIVNAINNLEL